MENAQPDVAIGAAPASATVSPQAANGATSTVDLEAQLIITSFDRTGFTTVAGTRSQWY